MSLLPVTTSAKLPSIVGRNLIGVEILSTLCDIEARASMPYKMSIDFYGRKDNQQPKSLYFSTSRYHANSVIAELQRRGLKIERKFSVQKPVKPPQ